MEEHREGAANLLDSSERDRFAQIVLPHLDAAHNLARWILGNAADAEDATQEAVLRACRYFRKYHGGNARSWLLKIVRNTCFTLLESHRPMGQAEEFDETLHTALEGGAATPETLAISSNEREQLVRALRALPPRFREVLVMRELEGCSYKEIAEIAEIPMGTVMSTLARAREKLQVALGGAAREEASSEL